MVNCIIVEEMSSNKQYHEEFNPPPEGSRTGLNKQEKVLPVSDANYASEHVQQRYILTLAISS